MNTNEISGKRQMEFLAEFDYIREAGTVGEEKAATIIQELSLIHISDPRDKRQSRMPSSA